jgi:hypothetical protein
VGAGGAGDAEDAVVVGIETCVMQGVVPKGIVRWKRSSVIVARDLERMLVLELT